jgi:hypothetical protein
MIHRPGIPRKREKGQPEGSAIKSKTRKPRVANTDRKTCYAAGRNEASAPKPILATPVGRCHHLKTVGEAAVMCEPARGEKDSPGGVASECVGPSRCGNPKRVAFGEAVRKCRSR